mmetsp:Transcript_2407/g.4851  ORF Transcript_2407/g.4851 Transcript_2407/m.4851 type:complete len:338 (+) Transcript_2407:133-1146(+)|eukprot:CAMPEP_0173409178 /NCGR_PEP_ID=MMETSP1356-20130122/71540_1 /TAXON_ID=77927 ORGANISM="Hemiselmis virescens, Strain PCC157" /NCGR_SAMPLE_ID=MMETSP1356 /ASSEMBLY_ACC=CAM_ASM_000847 /LENGTH=337 /DNA_ID=CAMNT_0014370605 /DNA_START=129 /DNA_END=1142 /DNA_ORIENTATION=+
MVEGSYTGWSNVAWVPFEYARIGGTYTGRSRKMGRNVAIQCHNLASAALARVLVLFVVLAEAAFLASGSEAVCRAAALGDVERLQHLCRAELGGGEVNTGWNSLVLTPDENGMYPAHHAALAGREDSLRAMHTIAAGSIQVQDALKRTPCHYAATGGHERVLVVLNELGSGNAMSNPDRFLRTPVHLAALEGHIDALRVLGELGHDLQARDNLGRMPTHLAAAAGRVNSLRCLHQLGAHMSLEAGDKYMRTPAHHAAETGRCEVLRVIQELCGGESLSLDDCDGRKPAHLAAQAGHERALMLLSELGAWVGASLMQTVRQQRPLGSSDVAALMANAA